MPLQFKRVTVTESNSSETNFNGRTVYYFTSPEDFPLIISENTNTFPFKNADRCVPALYGNPKLVLVYKDNILISEKRYSYHYVDLSPTSNYFVSQNAFVLHEKNFSFEPNHFLFNSILNSIPSSYVNREFYYPQCGVVLLDDFSKIDYSGNGVNKVEVTKYEYDEYHNVHKEINKNSKGLIIETLYYRPYNYSSTTFPILNSMLHDNRINDIVSVEKWIIYPNLERKIVAKSVNEFGLIGNGGFEVIKKYDLEIAKPLSLSEFGNFSPSNILTNNGYVKLMQSIEYDNKGIPSKVIHSGNKVDFAYTDDFGNKLITVGGCSNCEIGYTSFENSYSTGWSYNTQSPNLVISTTGIMGANLAVFSNQEVISSPNSLDPQKKYVLQYFTRGNNGLQANYIKILNENSIEITPVSQYHSERLNEEWYLHQYVLTGVQQVRLMADQYFQTIIDELVFYPESSQVNTYAYDNFGNNNGIMDINGNINKFEFDQFNRKTLIRDKYGNILKKICYNYAGQPENCCDGVSTAANWQNTATPPVCIIGNCGNTGYQNQEQSDINPCSPTYNQTRVVPVYNPTACPASTTAVTLTYANNVNQTGFSATYTNVSTGQVYTFQIPVGSGTLGCVPVGYYNIVISKPGNAMIFAFTTGIFTMTGSTGNFSNVYVTKWKNIAINYPD